MPIKRRISKRQNDLPDWEAMFTDGQAFAGEPQALGFDTEAHMREAAREAWSRLGELFMRDWHPKDTRPTPWAVEQFGEPRRCR